MSIERPAPFFRVDHKDGVPEDATLSLRGTIEGMQEGEWSVPHEGAVWFDHEIGRHFVDTYKGVYDNIPLDMLTKRPILFRAIGGRAVDYIADFRKQTNFRTPWGVSHYGEEGDTSPYRQIQKTRGTLLIRGGIYQTTDGPIYRGKDYLEDQAATFMRQVDEKLIDYTPEHHQIDGIETKDDVHQTDDDQPTNDPHTWQVSRSFGGSPLGRALRHATEAIDRASQRSARGNR